MRDERKTKDDGVTRDVRTGREIKGEWWGGKEREREKEKENEEGKRDMQIWSARLRRGSQRNAVGVGNIRGQRAEERISKRVYYHASQSAFSLCKYIKAQFQSFSIFTKSILVQLLQEQQWM